MQLLNYIEFNLTKMLLHILHTKTLLYNFKIIFYHINIIKFILIYFNVSYIHKKNQTADQL